jgi:hypothetical protein
MIAEMIATIRAEFDRDVRDINSDGTPEIVAQREIYGSGLPRAHCLLWPEIYSLTQQQVYERRSNEFLEFYINEYWPELVARGQSDTRSRGEQGVSNLETMVRARGLLLAQKVVLSNLCDLIETVRENAWEKTGRDPLLKPTVRPLPTAEIGPPKADTSASEDTTKAAAIEATPRSLSDSSAKASGGQLMDSPSRKESAASHEPTQGRPWSFVAIGLVGSMCIGVGGTLLGMRSRAKPDSLKTAEPSET